MQKLTQQQQLANNLQAAQQEDTNIAELTADLAKTTDTTAKTVLRERIKICKKFKRTYLLNAGSLQYAIANNTNNAGY
jgi:LPS O-antigen subunit length determinant protein (WzzB/FepE family)